MKKRTIVTTVGAAVLACGITGAAVAVAAGGGGDDEGHVTGPDADRAVAAALAETGATKANAVERDSENGAVWEVEVTRADGSQADVRLDADMHVVVVESDSESG
jgi:uncharacterized membrane protein YkoI